MLLAVAGTLGTFCQLTLDTCIARAQANYPLIVNYGLLDRTTGLELSDVNKGWLPRIGLYAQGTAQNVVAAFPDALKGLIDGTGHHIRGLGKEQYKVGVELNQTIYDGGNAREQRRVARADNAAQKARLDVELYAIRRRVQELYFGILLIDQQIEIAQDTEKLLEARLCDIKAKINDGVAMQSDADMIEAQILTLRQQIAQAEASCKAYCSALALFTGGSVDKDSLVVPDSEMPEASGNLRPELALYEARKKANDARLGSIDVSTMPRIGLFAQGYYGYPGYNYFESMMNRKLSLNVLAGIKISWNIDAFYTRSNTRRKLSLANETIDAERNTFMLNNNIDSEMSRNTIEGLRNIMADDQRIVELRTNVRRAAEARLENGVIDTTDLLAKISDENQARLNARYHSIELIQNIYNLKYIMNQ